MSQETGYFRSLIWTIFAIGLIAFDTRDALADDRPVLNVFLLAGQSNMAGADSEVLIPPGFVQTESDQKTRFTLAPLPGGDQAVSFLPWADIRGHEIKNKLVHGPEVGFARTLYAAGWRDMALIKVHANFGRDVKLWPWSEGEPLNRAWMQFVDNRLAELNAQGHVVQIKGFLWHQGIDDAIHGLLAPKYQQNLTELIGTLRKRFHAEKAPFILARSVNSPIAQPRPDPEGKSPMSIVRKAQVIVGETVSNSKWINVDDLPNVVYHHFSAESQLTIGERYGKAFLELVDQAGK